MPHRRRDDRGRMLALGLAPRDCMPRTIEEKIVTHADNLIAGTKRVTIDESIASASRLPKKIRKRMRRLSHEVEALYRAGKKDAFSGLYDNLPHLWEGADLAYHTGGKRVFYDDDEFRVLGELGVGDKDLPD